MHSGPRGHLHSIAPCSLRSAAHRGESLAASPRQGEASTSEATRVAGGITSATRSAQQVYELAETSTSASSAAQGVAGVDPTILAAVAGLGLSLFAFKRILDTPSRAYDNNVGQEYDAWTEEGVLEYYWGEHIHLGYYSDEELARGYLKKDFKQAKFDFVDEMLKFSGAQNPKKILDVGCGFGGTSRHLAKKFRDASVTGERLEAYTTG